MNESTSAKMANMNEPDFLIALECCYLTIFTVFYFADILIIYFPFSFRIHIHLTFSLDFLFFEKFPISNFSSVVLKFVMVLFSEIS